MYRPLESKHFNRNSCIDEFLRVARIETVPHQGPNLSIKTAIIAQFTCQQKGLTLAASPAKMADKKNDAFLFQGIGHEVTCGSQKPRNTTGSAPASLFHQLRKAQRDRL